MCWYSLVKGFETKAARREHDCLPGIDCSDYEILPMDIEGHKTGGGRCGHRILQSVCSYASWVDEARHLGLWKITHRYELDHHRSSQLRSFGRARHPRKRAHVSHAIQRSALTPRTTAASPPLNKGRVARAVPHDNILTTIHCCGSHFCPRCHIYRFYIF